ncbi:MAG: hypothetical protein MJ231_01785 [bacterium]|nr:hypothetical protein [bacterium]
MTDIILNNIYIILLLPLWVFLIIMLGRFFSVYVNKSIIYVLTLGASILGAILSGVGLYSLNSDKILETSFPFIKINHFIIECGLHVDKISLIFALVLFVVSFFVQLFSISYMKDEKKNYRFFALLNLFNFTMAGLFFSPNLFQTYFFWELVGVISYLLIGFEYKNPVKSLASKKVFIINRIGDTAFVAGIIMCSYFMFSYSNNINFTTLSYVDMNAISTLIYAYTSTPAFWGICLLFIIAALVKSAQVPFYTWLQDAMEAKLPVSALLHSATMVALGVFIILRLIPLFMLESGILKLIAVFGILTAFICSLCAASQNHPKKVLAYSTSAQLGLMFFALGALNIKAAVAFFVAHAVIKSMLFLTLPRENEKWSYVNFTAFLIGGLALSGMLLSGVASKELIFTSCKSGLSITAFSIISFLTAFYIFRIALKIASEGLEKVQPRVIELLAIIGLFIANILLYVYLWKYTSYKVAEPFWAALTAWVCTYILFIKNAFWKVPVLYPLTYNGFYLDNFYTNKITKIYEKCCQILGKFDSKVLTNYKPTVFVAKTGVRVTKWVETNIMNGAVLLVQKFSNFLSKLDLRLQSGNIQKYNAYAFIIITIIISLLLITYTTILLNLGVGGE